MTELDDRSRSAPKSIVNEARVTSDSGMERPLRDAIVISLVTIAFLVPFLGKAFHVDDPLFLWTARQIQKDPGNFYGFDVNWGSTTIPMHEEMQNPPLYSYYLALIASCFGWSEEVMHVAALLVSLTAALGIYSLARLLCMRPLLATFVAILTPVFIVSSTQIMCDVMLLAFWVWSLRCWIVGIEQHHRGFLLVGAILAGCAILTKYFGVALLPLLLLYAIVQRRWVAALFLIVPVAFLLGYEVWTWYLYGQPLFLSAGIFAGKKQTVTMAHKIPELAASLCFVGGCLCSVCLVAWSSRPFRALAVWLASSLAAIPLLIALERAVPGLGIRDDHGLRHDIVLQFALFGSAGLFVLWLVVRDVAGAKDRTGIVLACWIFGTVFFMAFMNWTVSARNLLPLVPAVGIVVVRRLGSRSAPNDLYGSKRVVGALCISGLISYVVAHADWQLARSDQVAARELLAKKPSKEGQLWFFGSWGFQYYMVQAGGKPVDIQRTTIRRGEIVVCALWSKYMLLLPEPSAETVRVVDFPAGSGLTTMSAYRSAAYYSTFSGRLPFSIGPVPPHRFVVQKARRDVYLPSILER